MELQNKWTEYSWDKKIFEVENESELKMQVETTATQKRDVLKFLYPNGDHKLEVKIENKDGFYDKF